MSIFKKDKARKIKQPGLPPGTIVHVGEKKTDKTIITIVDYDENTIQEKRTNFVEESFPFKNSPTKSWINVDGVHQVDILEKIGKHFDIHPLVLEDIAHIGQRPKVEEYASYIFIELNMIFFHESKVELESDQISFVLGNNFLLTFQEKERDIFHPIRERLRSENLRIRKLGVDYLLYSLIDMVVDNYFVVLEKMGEKLEELEETVMSRPTNKTLHLINQTKREMIALRKSVWPAREVISELYRSESPLINDTTDVYFRDVYDHTVQVMDTIENYRDIISGIQEIYLSSISIKTNEVMKVLTVISTIFIPLTFIVGIYGMNFRNMPELNWDWAYFAVMGIMFVIAVGMLFYFKRKKWF